MPESIFARTRFQAFLFAGGVILALVGIIGADTSQETIDKVINSVVAISLAAMLLFALALVVHWFRPSPKPIVEPQEQRAPKFMAWPSAYDIRVSRGFMLLGALIYMSYYFLDQFVIENQTDLPLLLYVRASVSVLIIITWLVSFASWFQRHYVMIMTVMTCFAGIGIGVMMFVAGYQVHFYYHGFIQVIAFAAFAFRLPPRPLAWECALLLLIYAALVAYQSWEPGGGFVQDRAQQAILVNNLVSLVTFVVLALTASVALAKVGPVQGVVDSQEPLSDTH